MERSALPYWWMLAGSLAFAIMGHCAHAAADLCDWRLVALARTLFALAFALVWAGVARARLVFWRPAALWQRSLAGSVSLVCSFYAFTHLPVGDAFTISNIFPIWVALLSWPMLGESPDGAVWLSVASSMVGVVIMQQPHLDGSALALSAALLASFTTALAMLGLHRLHQLDTSAIVVHFSFVGTAACALFLAVGQEATHWSTLADFRVVGLLSAVGISATIGQFFLTRAFAAGPPAKVAVVALSQAVMALGMDVWLWSRAVNTMTVLGMALILAPAAWLTLRRQRG